MRLLRRIASIARPGNPSGLIGEWSLALEYFDWMREAIHGHLGRVQPFAAGAKDSTAF
jgi:hypothetical protein